MASIDVSGYVDLAPYDREVADLIDRALLDAGAKLPGWVPREGNTEVVLIEALALEVAEIIYAANRIPGAVTEVLARLFGVERSEGVVPTTTITVTLTDLAGHEIPIGTTFRLPQGGSSPDLLFSLDAGVVVPAGSNVAAGRAATGDRATDEANATAAGTAVELIDPVSFIDSAVLATQVAGGVSPEGPVEFLGRAVQRFSRLNETLVLPAHFTAAALEEVGVFRATTIDNWNINASASGHVTVAVVGQGGAMLTAAAKTTLEDRLESLALANLDVHVVDPTITAVAITTTVMRLATYTSAVVGANVAAALDAYLSPDTWPWAGTVRYNELIALLDGVEGVNYVVNLTAPAGDVVLAGSAPLADLGALAVTVANP